MRARSKKGYIPFWQFDSKQAEYTGICRTGNHLVIGDLREVFKLEYSERVSYRAYSIPVTICAGNRDAFPIKAIATVTATGFIQKAPDRQRDSAKP